MWENELHIISSTEFEKEVHEEYLVFVLVDKEVIKNSSAEPPKELSVMLKEFQDIFSSELPNAIPFMRDIQHVINCPWCYFPKLAPL